MSLLTASEKAAAAADIREQILASGQVAVVLREVAAERLYGSDDAPYAEIASVPVEVDFTPWKDLRGTIDGTASVLPHADVRGNDRLRIGEDDFRVQTVKEHRLFGILTHKVVELVRLHGGS